MLTVQEHIFFYLKKKSVFTSHAQINIFPLISFIIRYILILKDYFWDYLLSVSRHSAAWGNSKNLFVVKLASPWILRHCQLPVWLSLFKWRGINSHYLSLCQKTNLGTQKVKFDLKEKNVIDVLLFPALLPRTHVLSWEGLSNFKWEIKRTNS